MAPHELSEPWVITRESTVTQELEFRPESPLRSPDKNGTQRLERSVRKSGLTESKRSLYKDPFYQSIPLRGLSGVL